MANLDGRQLLVHGGDCERGGGSVERVLGHQATLSHLYAVHRGPHRAPNRCLS